MRSSLDPAYIARQISMARNIAPAPPQANDTRNISEPTLPAEQVAPHNDPPLGPLASAQSQSSDTQNPSAQLPSVNSVIRVPRPSPTSSRPPSQPSLPQNAASYPVTQVPAQSQHPYASPSTQSPSQRWDGAAPERSGESSQARPSQAGPQSWDGTSQSLYPPPLPAVTQTAMVTAQASTPAQQISKPAATADPAPKRRRRSSSSSTRGSTRGRARGRGRGTAGGIERGNGRGGGRGRGRGRGRGQAQQPSVGREENGAPLLDAASHQSLATTQSMSPPAILPTIPAPSRSPPIEQSFTDLSYSQRQQADEAVVKSPYPEPPAHGAYPPLNNVQEAAATPYYNENRQPAIQQHVSLSSTGGLNERQLHDFSQSTQRNDIRYQALAVQPPPPLPYLAPPQQSLGFNQPQQQQPYPGRTGQPHNAYSTDFCPGFQGSFQTKSFPVSSEAQYEEPDGGTISEDDDLEDDVGDDPLLSHMQNNLATFEDSVRSFAAGGSEQSLLAQYRAEQQQPREKKVIKRGPRKAAEPTGDVKLRLSLATNAFMSGNLDEALHQVNDAIRLNAEIARSWSLLSEILREREEYKQALMASVCAAHLQPKILEVWVECGRFALELIEAEPDDAEDTLRIAIMTFSQAIKIQPDNVGARHTRAALYLTRQSFKLAVSEYNWIVERDPYDLSALRGLADASVQLFENQRRYSDKLRWEVRDAYLRAIEHFQAEFPMGTINAELPFTWEDVCTYTALLLHIEQYGAALHATRSLARWLLGRREETYWDNVEDDCEWDIGDERRKNVSYFDPHKYSTETYGAGFAIRLRVNLAICRLRLDRDNDDEAMQHLEFLDPADISNSEDDSEPAELFLEVASALYETKRLTKALPFYEPLRQQEDLLDALSLFRAGKCYLEMDDRRQAEQCFSAALDFDDTPSDVRVNARYELAKMYEAARKNEEALYLLEEAMGIEREQKELSGESGVEPPRREPRPRIIRSLAPKPILDKPPEEPRAPRERKAPVPRKPRVPGEKRQPREGVRRQRPLLFALDEDRKLEEERRATYLAEKWRIVREEKDSSEHGPGRGWMAAAKILIDDFRSFKAFFPWDRYLTQMGLKKDESGSSANPHLLKMAQRLRGEVDAQQSSINSRRLLETTVSYRNVEFSEWLDLFLEFALSLAYSGRIKESYDVCDAALAANVFFENPDQKFLANITKAACAVRGRDEETCVEVARSFMATYQYCSDAFRLYSALGRLVHSTGTWFAHSKVQKFTLRQIKMMDTKLLPTELKTKQLDQFDPKAYPAKEQDVQLLMLYGHILFISNSFTFALNYFVRAAALDPDNIMVNMAMGQAFLHYGLKRQTENRQQSITQGLLFLHRYYELKLAQAMTSGQRQEAHYNLARSYHAIGLSHLAAEYYRRVLREIEGDEVRDEDLAKETAFNLQQCCLIGGDMQAVRNIAEKWLVL
ncbi:hypothetical protein BKA67DRAFT_76467 [Truncatella angustata]|uniref:TPR-like protein n=1 Tax=Truncatella angustata TaxID=152316 RepID=A0A9P9A5B2_9PEZI|nr:uncharacterized protein BKA67DRAFT_76467 [Truncatella angustata]KAH6661145.1 hypothetical protein BKA67DRAFT_76467 [Truncatella angustata]KAH8202476.1 hypothetical protein TruAng_003376 [Truncatella angustata]